MNSFEKISYAQTVYGKEEVDAVIKCLSESTQMGNYSRKFEKKIANLFDKKLDNPVFYMFSDDIEWCRKNIKSSDKYFFVEANKDTPFENMELMSLCKHNIISNSTYEWWGAFLNKNKQKIVIYPKKWKFYETKKNKLIPSEWIKI